jgi:beta-mannosidase
VAALSNAVFYTVPLSELLKGLNKEELVLSTVLKVNGLVISENLLYFNHPKTLLLQKPEIKTEITQNKKGFEITLATNTLAKSVYLSLPNGDDEFSDNFFDLLPNKTVKIRLNTTLSINELKSKLIIRSLIDSQK